MNQVNLADVVARGNRLGLRQVAGPLQDIEADGVEIVLPEDLAAPRPGRLAIVAAPPGAPLRPFQLDVAIRRAIAARCAGLVFVGDFPLAETARALAERGRMPVLISPASPSELAVFLDRAIRGGAEEAM